jgi:hypothetical protein
MSVCSDSNLCNIQSLTTTHFATFVLHVLKPSSHLPPAVICPRVPCFKPSVHQFVAARFAVVLEAFTPFQSHTFHSSDSLSHAPESSHFHNYNDTIVHIVHIGFRNSDSCRSQYLIRAVFSTYTAGPGFCSTPPIISKRAKIIELNTVNPKHSASLLLSVTTPRHATPRKSPSTGTNSRSVVLQATTHCLPLHRSSPQTLLN